MDHSSMYHPTTTTDSDVLLSSSSAFYSPPVVNQQLQYSAGPPLLPAPTHHLPDFPIRRVFSTGDLKEHSINAASGGGAATGTVVGRYSAEERRERIDKYRSKRNHRNFHKKITYACRKTLADSRPRVKGRFARNGGEPDLSEPNVDIITAGGGSSNAVNDGDIVAKVPDWWPAMQEALLEREKAEEDEEVLSGILHCNDDELLAAYLGVSSINLYSSPMPPSHS